jgi:hypothetical protein
VLLQLASGESRPRPVAAANPELRVLLREYGLAAGSSLFAAPPALGPIRSHHPLDLLVQPQLIAQEAFLAPDSVRDRSRLAPILGGEDVRGVAILLARVRVIALAASAN